MPSTSGEYDQETIQAMSNKTRYLTSSVINSFHYLYQDAEYLLSAAQLPSMSGSFQITRICRSAMLLYILSLEGLVNRALDHFVPKPHHDFFIEREDRFQLMDKWKLLFLLVPSPPIEIDLGDYPWSHVAELIKVRNDYVHPKHDRKGYYEFSSVAPDTKAPLDMKGLDWKNIPEGSGIKEKDIVYGQTKLPKDPYQLGITHLQTVKKIIDDCVASTNSLLSGRLSKDNWVGTEQMTVFFPAGTTFQEIG
jgi:hypothetical protein